ncbi:MAG: hypothetical protein LBL21_00135 [Rickettsiales bacterium]|nr:hypothetical protein [Rickettsiales bacterium]
MAEIRRKKWEHTPEYNKAANAAYDIIEKNRARLNKNAGENELNRVR